MASRPALIDHIGRAFGGTERPDRIGVAVSGGSDSLALLHLLVDWGQATLAVATVDHGLRDGSADEVRAVAETCERLNVPHTSLSWTDWDGHGNLQDEARQGRYRLLADWARAEAVDTVALGHTMDDQAETFLMRLSRSSGIDGLQGMAGRIVRHNQRFDRPLLGLRRGDLREYLSQQGVSWIDDPSNTDDRFERVKARRALSVLEDIGVTPEAVTQSMAHLDKAALALRVHACEIAQNIAKDVEGDLVFDRTALRALTPELRHRILTNALGFVASERYPPRSSAVAEVEKAIADGKNHTLHGCLTLVSDMTVRITREFNAVSHLTGATDELWDSRWLLDGPHTPGLVVRALGDAVKDTQWRETGLPRQSLLSSPAVWQGETLVAAPLAGLSNGWTAQATGRGKFTDFLMRR